MTDPLIIIRDDCLANGLAVIACGGRHYADKRAVFAALDTLHARPGGVSLLIEGGNRPRANPDGTLPERSADYLAYLWAKARGVRCVTMAADFDSIGRRAGPMRNREMLTKLLGYARRGVVAFPSDGPGTRDMVKAATAAGVRVWKPCG